MSIYLESALLILVFMLVLFVLAIARRDNSIADIGWGIGFTIIATWMHLFHSHSASFLILIMVGIWGIRLSLHLLSRSLRKGKEDWRYANWRQDWGKNVILQSFFRVFLLQGFFMCIIALPILQQKEAAGISALQLVGLVIWLAGFGWEALADWQLARFKRQPQNKRRIMTQGLWRLSRHPNYFGEILVWWGLAIFVLPYGKWWICLLSALTITWLLLRVSGVPMLESKYADDVEYQEYRRQTNALLPDLRKWF